MEKYDNDKVLYSIVVEDIQNEAKYILGRELSDDEIDIVKDGLDWGIGETIGIIYHTILTEILPERMNEYEEKEKKRCLPPS